MPIIKDGQVVENKEYGVYPSEVRQSECVPAQNEDGSPMTLFGKAMEVCNVGGNGEEAKLELRNARAPTTQAPAR